jgi:hypothetical protein
VVTGNLALKICYVFRNGRDGNILKRGMTLAAAVFEDRHQILRQIDSQ